ncbi:NAD(P)-binding protein [Trichoderma chlorosporum]
MASEGVIKKIVWYGGARLGGEILQRMTATKKYDITFIGRKDPSEYKKIPEGIPIVQIDLKDHKSLVKALTGADAVIVFTRFGPGGDLDIVQLALINAAIEAGVKLFVPSEWAPDTAGAYAATTSRIGPNTLPPNPVVAPKRVTHNYLLARSAEGKIDFVSLHAGNLLINVTAFSPMDLNKRTASLGDGGHGLISISSLDTLGKGLDSLLTQYPKFKNGFFYICDGVTTLQQIVKSFQDASESKEPWEITSFSIADRKEAADENMRNGIFTWKEFASVLTYPFTGGLTAWEDPDNEKLGLPLPSDERAQRVVDDLVQRSVARGYII